MADEINSPETVAADATPAAVATPEQKRRQPRRAKALSDAAGVTVEGQIKQRKKRTPKAVQPAAGGSEKPASAVRGRGRRAARPTEESAVSSAPVSAADEMADLLQLEAENKRLRQILAEKLRAENADLRKRLGLA
jgi:putative transposase